MFTKEQHEQKCLEFDKVCQELLHLYHDKNLDYGDSFGKSFQEWGMPMACIRLTDKLNRLCALTKNDHRQVKDESIEDTLRDLANYSIMTIIELDRLKGPANAD